MTNTQPPPQPQEILFQMLFGRTVSFAISAVARLGIADHMNGRPMTAQQIAAQAGVNEPALFRVMRTLSAVGVFASTPDGFVLTPVGELLRSNAPGSLRNMATMLGDEWISAAYSRMDHCIRTGNDGVTAAFGKHAFDLFAERPSQGETFHRAMTDFTTVVAADAVEVYDFSRFRRMADAGGGHGILLGTILRKCPALRGVLFDLAPVVKGRGSQRTFYGLRRPHRIRTRQFPRARSLGLRRLHHEAHHPRLERRRLLPHPRLHARWARCL